MNQDQDLYSLILESKTYGIPSRVISLFNNDIYGKLLTTKQYFVRSNVDDKIFQSFVDYLVTKKTPNICFENISQYDQLSDEFGCMQSIIQLFRKLTANTERYIHLSKKEELEHELFEKNNKLLKEKNKHCQIIQNLFKSKGISTKEEFLAIKDELSKTVRGVDVDQIEILMRKKVTQNDLVFSLNQEEKTAGLYRCLSKNDTIFVPYSINYQSKEFIVTRIQKFSFSSIKTIKAIQFPENSEMRVIENKSFVSSSLESIKLPSKISLIEEMAFYRCDHLKKIELSENSNLNTIEKSAFDSSSIETLSIPSSISDLKSGWCNGATNLNHIQIIPNNRGKNLSYFDDKFVLGKSDTKSDIFDVLIFARRDIEKAIIPAFIKKIDQFAFCNCNQLKIVEFEENSKLEIIDSCSFSGSSIENILIPSSVTCIGDSCFASCQKLKSIQFLEDSQLFSIGKFAFFYSTLESIIVPPLVRQIAESAFMMCTNLKKVEFSENSKLRSIENYAFNSASIESLTIPSSLFDFKGMCFCQTLSLNDIKIIPKHQQNIIYYDNKFILKKSDPTSNNFDTLLLARRDIENVKIPAFIQRIAQHAFDNCSKIKSIEFSHNSNLKLIGNYSFCLSSIESINIPSNVIKIEKFAFSNCKNLKNVVFSSESKLKLIDEFAFARSSIESITLPSEIVRINKFAFGQCYKLRNVDFLEKSKIETIEDAFSYSTIESLSIPSSIINLSRGWCSYTKKLNNIKIYLKKDCENIKYYENKIIIGKSNLKSQVFDVLFFTRRDIEKITIPSFIRIINSYSFNQCLKIQKLEFNNDSKLEIIDKYSFNGCLFTSVLFPPHVKKIDYASFSECKNLLIFQLFDNSESCQINKNAFGIARSNIIIMIPAKKITIFFSTW